MIVEKKRSLIRLASSKGPRSKAEFSISALTPGLRDARSDAFLLSYGKGSPIAL